MKKERLIYGVLAVLVIVVAILAVKVFSAAETPAAGTPVVKTSTLSTLDKIEQTGKLEVCYVELPPSVIKDPSTGKLSGVMIDMINYLAESMGGVEIEFQSTTWGTFPADLNSHRCDLTAAATFITIPRARTIAYSRPIAYTGNSALVRKGSGLEDTQSIDDFDAEGITIAVLNGEQGHEYVKQHFSKATIRVIEGSDDTLPLVEVLNGRADVGLHESVVVARFAEQHPEVVDVFAENPYNPVQIAWAMRNDDMAWVNFVSTAINTMEASGKLAEFEGKYQTYWLKPKVELTK